MKKKIFNTLWVVGVLTFAGFCLPACHRDLDVQKAYPFKVETMPVAKELTQGQTAEIRCSLRPSGLFQDTRYTLRFFQYYGKGALRMTPTSKPLLPNNRYPIEAGDFRLYYTSESKERQQVEIVFEDNHGQRQTLSLDFNNKDDNKDKQL